MSRAEYYLTFITNPSFKDIYEEYEKWFETADRYQKCTFGEWIDMEVK